VNVAKLFEMTIIMDKDNVYAIGQYQKILKTLLPYKHMSATGFGSGWLGVNKI